MKRLFFTAVILSLGCPAKQQANSESSGGKAPGPHRHIQCFDMNNYIVLDTTDIRSPPRASDGYWLWWSADDKNRFTISTFNTRCVFRQYAVDTEDPDRKFPCDKPPLVVDHSQAAMKVDRYQEFMRKNSCGNRICSPWIDEECREGKCVVQTIGWEDGDCGMEREPCPNDGACHEGVCFPRDTPDAEVLERLGMTNTEKP